MSETVSGLEKTYPLPQVRKATPYRTNVSLKKACARFGIPILVFSSKTKALSESGYRLLLQRVSESA